MSLRLNITLQENRVSQAMSRTAEPAQAPWVRTCGRKLVTYGDVPRQGRTVTYPDKRKLTFGRLRVQPKKKNNSPTCCWSRFSSPPACQGIQRLYYPETEGRARTPRRPSMQPGVILNLPQCGCGRRQAVTGHRPEYSVSQPAMATFRLGESIPRPNRHGSSRAGRQCLLSK